MSEIRDAIRSSAKKIALRSRQHPGWSQVLKRAHAVKEVASFVANNFGYHELRSKFIDNGASSPWGVEARREIVERFEAIDRSVPLGSTPTDGLFLAEALLNTTAEGAVVECGCYAGGSSAKLSIICKLIGKRLHVFDSFEGLPAVDAFNLRDFHARHSNEWVTDWSQGRYAARLDQVQGNVRDFGELEVCSFTKGWFSDTLSTQLPTQICFAFVDVDIPSSARDCLVPIWPRLQDGGVFFSHDAAYIKVLQALFDPKLWRDELKAFPPIFFGGGFGLGDCSPHLGFFVKGDAVSAEHIKSLTINK